MQWHVKALPLSCSGLSRFLLFEITTAYLILALRLSSNRCAPVDDGSLADLAVPELLHALRVDLQRQLGRIRAAAGRRILRLCGLCCRLFGGLCGWLSGLALGSAHCAGQARMLRKGDLKAERSPWMLQNSLRRRCQARAGLMQACDPGDATQRPHSQLRQPVLRKCTSPLRWLSLFAGRHSSKTSKRNAQHPAGRPRPSVNPPPSFKSKEQAENRECCIQ